MFMFCFLEKGLKMAKIRNRYKREFKLKQSYNRYRTSYQTGVTRPNTSSLMVSQDSTTESRLTFLCSCFLRRLSEPSRRLLFLFYIHDRANSVPQSSLFDDDSLRVGPKRPNHWGRNDIKMGSKWPGAETSLIRADDGAKRAKVLDFSCWIKSSVSLMYSWVKRLVDF